MGNSPPRHHDEQLGCLRDAQEPNDRQGDPGDARDGLHHAHQRPQGPVGQGDAAQEHPQRDTHEDADAVAEQCPPHADDDGPHHC